MPAEASLANLQPWQPGNTAPRRSNQVDQALRQARSHCPRAIKYCGMILNDETVDHRFRLKAAEIILQVGMPKGEAAKAFVEGDVGAITIHVEYTQAPAAPSAPAEPQGPVITIDTEPAGSGD